MTALIYLVTIPFISVFLVNLKQFKQLSDFLKNKLPITKGKPFNCNFCIGFWLSLTYHIFSEHFLLTMLVSFACASLSFLTEINLMRKR